MLITSPFTPYGTMIFCVTTGVSFTVPKISPSSTTSPTFAVASKSHFNSRLRDGT